MKTQLASVRTLCCLAFFLGSPCFLALNHAYAVVPTVVVPNGDATIEGGIDNGFPFNIAAFGLPTQRYQQLNDASQFAAIPAGGGFITQIIFRPDAVNGAAFMSTLPNMQINLSTTSVADDALSLTFANNVGINDTIVFAGALSLASAFTGPPNGPKDFDIVINLTTPFFYNPSLGNLLLDVRNFGGGSTTPFDAEFTAGDGVSRVSTYTNGNVNSTMADFGDTAGLVTGFTFSAVPEPGATMLFACGGILLAWFGCRRQLRRD